MSTLLSRPAAEPASEPASPWLRRILIANLVGQVGIVVTGGLVRLTGSGLGCPTWPQCTPGSYTPVAEQAEGFHKYIEFGNRLLTGVVGILALLVIVAVLRWAGRRRDLLWAGIFVLAGVATQAVVGGITVLTGLNPLFVATHFLVSMVLVAASAYALARAVEPPGDRPLAVHPLVARASWVVCAMTAVVLLLGTLVTGAGPHSGDAETPARLGLDPRMLSWLHADAVMLLVGLVVGVWLGARLTGRDGRPGRSWAVVLVVVLAQGLVGYVQYFTGLPEVLVLVHMFGAAALVSVVARAMVHLRRSTSRL